MDDETASPSKQMRLRAEVMQRLQQQWHDLAMDDYLDKVVLHYLEGKIHVDVFLDATHGSAERARQLVGPVREAACNAEDIGKVNVYVAE